MRNFGILMNIWEIALDWLLLLLLTGIFLKINLELFFYFFKMHFPVRM